MRKDFSMLKQSLEQKASLVEHWLSDCCAQAMAEGVPPRLVEAMEYSLLAGGKRIRPFLCLSSGSLFGVDAERLRPMAVALEMIHTASLIHDDLPCMDNDVLRRGKPTNHVVFGEGLALLAGDALLAWAIQYPLESLSAEGIPADRIMKAMALFSRAIGPRGICGGQVLDSDPPSQEEDLTFVTRVAREKTAILIHAAVVTGAILAGADGPSLESLDRYGMHLGVAFQIIDDILDVAGLEADLGKSIGKDAEQGKCTFVTCLGLEGARRMAREETDKACSALERFDHRKVTDLLELALMLQERSS